MGKNNKLINSLKEVARRNRDNNLNQLSDEMVPPLYASVALALRRKHKFGYQRIKDTIAEIERIWVEFDGSVEDMIDLCEKETGVRIKLDNPSACDVMEKE